MPNLSRKNENPALDRVFSCVIYGGGVLACQATHREQKPFAAQHLRNDEVDVQ
jgi:hypothetical protein